MTDEVLDIRAIVARIDRDMAETHKLISEAGKLTAEQHKLAAEGSKFNRERWQIPLVAIVGLLGILVGKLL